MVQERHDLAEGRGDGRSLTMLRRITEALGHGVEVRLGGAKERAVGVENVPTIFLCNY